MRIAFCGASGTGKTTLARDWLAPELGLEFNPVGSRSVSKAMGYDSPYDVDAAGHRAEFQRRLMFDKRMWERDRESFVSDRTTFDNLCYFALHSIGDITDEVLEEAVEGMQRYTHIFYCPERVFINYGTDKDRVHVAAYHRVYDGMLLGLLERHDIQHFTILSADLEERRKFVRAALAHLV